MGDGVEDTGRRGSKGGDGPKMKMCLKYCGWGGCICFRGLQVSCRNIKQNQSKTRLPFAAQEVLKLLISKRPKLKPLLRITTYTINKHP